MKIPFVGPAFEGRSRDFSYQRCLNLYLEPGDRSTKGPAALYNTPGLKKVASIGVGPMRGNGIDQHKGNGYFVSGSELLRIDTGYNSTSLGNLDTSSGRIGIAEIGDQVMTVDGSTDGYIYDGTTFAKISDADFPGGTHVTDIDGYFVVNKPDSDQFHISALRDGKTWAATDFARKERHSDYIKALIADHRELWLLGEHTTEIWYNSGNVDFPFEALSNGFIEWGIAAPHSLQKMDNGIVWLGQTHRGSGYVVRTRGYTPQVISTPWLEYEFNTYSTIEDAEAYVYQQAGHEFYVLTFPKANKTWAYDARINAWHERGTYLVGRHRSSGFLFFNEKNVVGDYDNSNIYELDLDTYTDNSVTIERVRSSPPIHQDRKWLFHHSLEMDFESGVGLTSGQGSDPQIMLRWSDDGGHTWSNEHWRSMGKKGEYFWRAVWRQMGRSRNRIYETKITDPVKIAMVDAYGNITPADY